MVTIEQVVCVFWLVVLAPSFVIGLYACWTMPHIEDPGMMPF